MFFTRSSPSKALLDRFSALEDHFLELQKREARLGIAHAELLERQETLEGQLHKLRGQVMGPRAQLRAVNSVDAIPFGDKDALRKAAGIQPGLRFTHEKGED